MKIKTGKTGKHFSQLLPERREKSGKMAVWLYANPLSRFPESFPIPVSNYKIQIRKAINMANEMSNETCGTAQVAKHKPLTAKREQFAQAIADGMNQTDAYRLAYSASGMTAQTVWVKASQLAGQDNVRIRIDKLKAGLAEKRLWTRAQSVEALKRALDLAEESQQPAAITRVVRELNNMHGFNAPKQLDLNVAAAARTITPDMTAQEASEAYAAMLVDPRSG